MYFVWLLAIIAIHPRSREIIAPLGSMQGSPICNIFSSQIILLSWDTGNIGCPRRVWKSVKTEEQLREFRPRKQTFLRKNREVKERQDNGCTVLERLSSERGNRFMEFQNQNLWVEVTGRQFSALCKEECFSTIGHWGTLNSIQFLSTEDVEEEAHTRVSWMLFKGIPFGGNGHLPVTLWFLIQTKLGFTSSKLVGRCGLSSCIFLIGNKSRGFHCKYLRTSCCHENFQEPGWILCSFFQSVLCGKKKKEGGGEGEPSQPCSASTLLDGHRQCEIFISNKQEHSIHKGRCDKESALSSFKAQLATKMKTC